MMKATGSIACSILAAAFIAVGASSWAKEGADYEVSVDGLACPFCAYGIEKHLRQIDGVEKVQTDVAAGMVELWTVGGAELSRSRVERAVSDAGFDMKEFNRLHDGG